jgi:hypothetical protein
VTAHLHLECPQFQGLSWRSIYDHRNIWLRLIGPGRIAVQSVCSRQSSERIKEQLAGHLAVLVTPPRGVV